MNLMKLAAKKIVKSRQVNLVLAGFSKLEPLHQLPTTVLSHIMERKKVHWKNICTPI